MADDTETRWTPCSCGRRWPHIGAGCPGIPALADDTVPPVSDPHDAAAVKDAQAEAGVLAEVAAERERQDAKWGEQNHPNGTGGGRYAERAEIAKATTDRLAEMGRCTYRAILDEEVAEAFAEDHPAALRGELIQVAAVAVAWVEKIDRDALRAAVSTPGGTP